MSKMKYEWKKVKMKHPYAWKKRSAWWVWRLKICWHGAQIDNIWHSVWEWLIVRLLIFAMDWVALRETSAVCVCFSTTIGGKLSFMLCHLYVLTETHLSHTYISWAHQTIISILRRDELNFRRWDLLITFVYNCIPHAPRRAH